MANKVLIQQNSIVQAYPIQSFPSSNNVRVIQFNPQAGVGFTGSVVIEGSISSVPGNNSFSPLLNVSFTGHTQNLTLEVQSNSPNIRARIASSSQGAVAVFADSANRSNVAGGRGATPATASVESGLAVAGTGNSFAISAAVVNEISTDDVVDATNFSLTLTDVLNGTNGAAGKQDKIGSGVISALDTDLNLLAGVAAYGGTVADFQKLADLNASAAELNRTIGVTSNIQTQLNAIVASVPADVTGQATSGSAIDTFFDTTPTVTIADLNNINGLTASAADLNILDGTAGTFTSADLTKLGDITVTAAVLNALSGFTGTSNDLNRIVGMTSSNDDLNAISGLAGTTVTATQIGFLSGLNQNVQTALSGLPSFVGLTASVNDLNTMAGIFSGTGGYSSSISATEIGYLEGLASSIQDQLDGKRSTGVAIGVSEISGASITTTELNYLQSVRSNVQAQIDAISVGTITPAGGTFTGPVYISNGTAASPGLGFTAPNNSTGFYLFDATGLGITVAGSSFITMNGVSMSVGPAVTGTPTMYGSGVGVSRPAYTFTDDIDTGIYRSAGNAVAIAGGGQQMAEFNRTTNEITLGGTASNNMAVSVTGVFAGEKVLGSAAIQAGSSTGATGQTTLYTVPTGRSTIVTKVLVRLTNVASFTDGSLLRMNIGFGGSFDEIVDNTNNTTVFNPGTYSFDTAAQVMPLGAGDNAFPAISGSSGADYQTLTAGTALRADIVAQAGATEFDMEVIVFGYEF